MARIESAGTLLYRKRGEKIEVLIVHPSGEYNKNALWSIPKGHIEKDEVAELAARRETWEETGVTCPEKLTSLGFVDYKSKKRVHGFAGEALPNTSPVPTITEVDRAEFVEINQAEKLLHDAQKAFIGRLKNVI